jgi:hypothetical protein
MMKLGAIGGLGGASLIVLALVLTPALAASQKSPRSRPAATALGGGIGSFTPAVADPRLAAVFARKDQLGSFHFTPATTSLGKSKAVRVAVRARSTTAAQALRTAEAAPIAVTAVTPAAYDLGVAVGWKRFAVSGDVARVQNGILPGKRDSAEVGVAYLGKKAGGRLKVAAERVDGSQRLAGPDATYSVDVGASYSIARNLDVTGGVRYKVQEERLRPLADERRDSQAVYIGTAFRF